MAHFSPAPGYFARGFLNASKDVGDGDPHSEDNPLSSLSSVSRADSPLEDILDRPTIPRDELFCSFPSHIPALAKGYLGCIDTMLNKVLERATLRLLVHPTDGNSPMIDARTIIRNFESDFFPSHKITPLPLHFDRAMGMIICIHHDLSEIHSRDVAHFRQLISSFDSTFGQHLKEILSAADHLPDSAEGLFNMLDLSNRCGRMTVPKLIGVALLARAVNRFPERMNYLSEGQDYRLEGYFADLKPVGATKVTMKDRYDALQGELSKVLMDSISDDLAELLPQLTAHMFAGGEVSRGYYLDAGRWARSLQIRFKESDSKENFFRGISPELKYEILALLHKIFRSKIRMGLNLGLTLDQIAKDRSPFFAPVERYYSCVRMIDSFSFNQIIHVWNEQEIIPYNSFAMRENRMVVRELPKESHGSPARIAVQYSLRGNPTTVTITRGDPFRDSRSALPVCVWVLNTFLQEARQTIGKDPSLMEHSGDRNTETL